MTISNIPILFNSASNSFFGHDPLVAEVQSLKHEVMEMKNTITELKEMIKHMADHSRVAGQRVEAKPSGVSAKNPVIEDSRTYIKSHNNILEGGPIAMDDFEPERFTWMKIGFEKREMLALIADDHMFSYLGADNDLPLFAFSNSWGSKNLLIAAIRNRVK
ncbi:uncharacterized protein EV154DRAFT_487077 [Mucor mucedo]|uniref:uncharacterized protein n=1 Tax=Mucor mucedo TaxID=29922 RepID=UPI00221E5DAF|nr:uncharacterized protein EV154DRAFT_487077 [Mucor mucedo]KAI7873755.1 hypothetical protein EV154DRAFT_487077 [Mucor mucedo]